MDIFIWIRIKLGFLLSQFFLVLLSIFFLNFEFSFEGNEIMMLIDCYVFGIYLGEIFRKLIKYQNFSNSEWKEKFNSKKLILNNGKFIF